MSESLVWHREDCFFCGGCVAVCPREDVLTLQTNKLEIVHKNCTRCGLCVRGCPIIALCMEGE